MSSRMTSSGSCSSAHIPPWPPTPRSLSSCGSSPASRPVRSPGRSWCLRRRWRNGSFGPNANCTTITPPTAYPARRSSRTGSHAVLAAIYLIYTEGHTATSGQNLTRTDLSSEAIRLGRTLVELMPDEPEAIGLLALMLLSESRRPARSNPDGTMVRLADQDRSRWDKALIIEGHQLVRACLRRNQPGPFQIQAAIAAVHADAPTAEATDWSQIIALYDQLYALRPHPVVALNRSVAVAELHGPAEGLAALAAIDAGTLDTYQPYHAARADLLARAGRRHEALGAYDRAIELTTNAVERAFLVRQRAAL